MSDAIKRYYPEGGNSRYPVEMVEDPQPDSDSWVRAPDYDALAARVKELEAIAESQKDTIAALMIGCEDGVTPVLRRLDAAEQRVRELQVALCRWLPEIAGDESSPMHKAATSDALLLIGLREQPECFGQKLWERVREVEADAKLERAVQRAAELLPFGYDVKVVVERGSGWIECTDLHGKPVAFADDDLSLADAVNAAIDAAIAHFTGSGSAG